MLDDVAEGGDGAAVRRRVAEGEEGVGEGVRLELQADLDDIERCDDEAEAVLVTAEIMMGMRLETYRDTSPAIAPADMVWSLEPCIGDTSACFRMKTAIRSGDDKPHL